MTHIRGLHEPIHASSCSARLPLGSLKLGSPLKSKAQARLGSPSLSSGSALLALLSLTKSNNKFIVKIFGLYVLQKNLVKYLLLLVLKGKVRSMLAIKKLKTSNQSRLFVAESWQRAPTYEFVQSNSNRASSSFHGEHCWIEWGIECHSHEGTACCAVQIVR